MDQFETSLCREISILYEFRDTSCKRFTNILWQTETGPIVRKRHALLSQERSAARRVARGEVPDADLVKMRHWNLLSRDLDCVSIALSS